MGSDHPPFGSICHIEIPAPDLAKAKSFYQSVFGWTMEDIPEMPYVMFSSGTVGGGFDPALEVVDKGVNVIIEVADIPSKLVEISEAGGGIEQEKTEIAGGFGFYAVFKDPNGNRLSIHSAE
ncbi:VOC family protein [Planctomycetota bacterium]